MLFNSTRNLSVTGIITSYYSGMPKSKRLKSEQCRNPDKGLSHSQTEGCKISDFGRSNRTKSGTKVDCPKSELVQILAFHCTYFQLVYQ